MTDLQRFIDLYKSVGIDLKPEKIRDQYVIHLESGSNEKLEGYTFFYSNIYFDKNGKFLSQGFYE